MAVHAIVLNEITVLIENNYEFRVAFCYCKERRVTGILGVLVLDIFGTMVIMQNNFWSAVLLICLKKHHLIDSEIGVMWCRENSHQPGSQGTWDLI